MASLEDPETAEPGTALLEGREQPDEVLAGLELGAALERAIRALDPGQREVLVLRDTLSQGAVLDALEKAGPSASADQAPRTAQSGERGEM